MKASTRRSLALFAPVALAFCLSDKLPSDFGAIMVGSLLFGIPFWLAWWLSDGFSSCSTVANGNDSEGHEGMFSPPKDPSIDRWDYWGHQQRQQREAD